MFSAAGNFVRADPAQPLQRRGLAVGTKVAAASTWNLRVPCRPTANPKEHDVPNRKNNQEQGGREGQQREQVSQASTRQSKGRGFAAMNPEQQREIASEGGRAAHASGHAHEFTSEEARAAGRKGGEARSHNAQSRSSSSESRSASTDRDIQGEGSQGQRGGRGQSGH
jgi:general stress protein YciG